MIENAATKPLTIKEWVEAALIHDGRYGLEDVVGMNRTDEESGDCLIELKMSDGEAFPIRLNARRDS